LSFIDNSLELSKNFTLVEIAESIAQVLSNSDCQCIIIWQDDLETAASTLSISSNEILSDLKLRSDFIIDNIALPINPTGLYSGSFEYLGALIYDSPRRAIAIRRAGGSFRLFAPNSPPITSKT
jgi:hypothetical protein